MAWHSVITRYSLESIFGFFSYVPSRVNDEHELDFFTIHELLNKFKYPSCSVYSQDSWSVFSSCLCLLSNLLPIPMHGIWQLLSHFVRTNLYFGIYGTAFYHIAPWAMSHVYTYLEQLKSICYMTNLYTLNYSQSLSRINSYSSCFFSAVVALS